jgi:2-keto-4-pentenoate hydratase
LVLSGAVGPMFSVKAGDTVLAEFDVLGSVSITFSN